MKIYIKFLNFSRMITKMCVRPENVKVIEKDISLFYNGVLDNFEQYAFSLHCAYVNVFIKFNNKSDFLEVMTMLCDNKDLVAEICYETLEHMNDVPFTNACGIVIDDEKMKQSLDRALDHSEYYFYIYGEAKHIDDPLLFIDKSKVPLERWMDIREKLVHHFVVLQ